MKIKKKRIAWIIAIAVLVISLSFLVYAIFTILAPFFEFFSYTPIEELEPKIVYSEFDIKIVYSVDGDVKVIEDTLICEYKGIERLTFTFKFMTGVDSIRIWDMRLASGNEDRRLILYQNDEYIIDYSLGVEEYFMGDPQMAGEPSFRVFFLKPSGEVDYSLCYLPDEVDALREYGVEILECVLPEPVENTFGK